MNKNIDWGKIWDDFNSWSAKQTLIEWTKTVLWFKRGINDSKPLEFCVLVPPGCSVKDRVKLLEKNASQIVGLIQKLTGEKFIIQGQCKSEPPMGWEKQRHDQIKLLVDAQVQEK